MISCSCIIKRTWCHVSWVMIYYWFCCYYWSNRLLRNRNNWVDLCTPLINLVRHWRRGLSMLLIILVNTLVPNLMRSHINIFRKSAYDPRRRYEAHRFRRLPEDLIRRSSEHFLNIWKKILKHFPKISIKKQRPEDLQ